MKNEVTLIAGHNVIMDAEYAAQKFNRGEITNRQIVTTQADWDAVAQGRVGTLEEQSSMGGWGQTGGAEEVAVAPTVEQMELEEQARVEAQGYVANGGVDWGKVENDTTGVETMIGAKVIVGRKTDPSAGPVVSVAPVVEDKSKLLAEFEEFLAWKQSRGGK